MTKTYAQLAREIAALQASAQKQLAVEAKGAIAKINAMISTYGLTAGDLKFASTAAAASRPESKAKKVTKGATKGKRRAASQGAKFSDGQGHQWSGRGPRPAWLREAMAYFETRECMYPVASSGPRLATFAAPSQIRSSPSAADRPLVLARLWPARRTSP